MSATTTEVRRSHSLKRRLLASMAAAFLLLLLLISVLLWNYSRAAANRTYDLLLAGAALSVLERVSYNSAGPTVVHHLAASATSSTVSVNASTRVAP